MVKEKNYARPDILEHSVKSQRRAERVLLIVSTILGNVGQAETETTYSWGHKRAGCRDYSDYRPQHGSSKAKGRTSNTFHHDGGSTINQGNFLVQAPRSIIAPCCPITAWVPCMHRGRPSILNRCDPGKQFESSNQTLFRPIFQKIQDISLQEPPKQFCKEHDEEIPG